MTRHQANMTLLEVLKGYLQDNPDIRFGQALVNLGIVEIKFEDTGILGDSTRKIVLDPFYEEPTATLTRVQEVYK